MSDEIKKLQKDVAVLKELLLDVLKERYGIFSAWKQKAIQTLKELDK